ncbi:AAA family ATPase [Pseudonocardia sp. NPDC049635]|uniref:ATP-binding protein n=1 Tax=Pseudonocardia sp. NPDC049635 TaxID=3155506 RepID=UPI0033C2E4F5
MGRRAEREAVEQLLAKAQDGRCGVLVIRGEAGIGKTALLEHARAVAAPAGFRVEGLAGVESESEFAFAGLHQLCAPLLDRVGLLSEPQQAALGVALGERSGPAPDRFLVGLAALNLLAETAGPEPLLCLVDDAQWLDRSSAQVLAFVARRVSSERVALLFTLRDPHDGDGTVAAAFDGLPDLHLTGLGENAARALLSTAVRTPLDDGVRDRIVTEARGNPLALLELSRHTDPIRLTSEFHLPDTMGVPRRIEETFRRRSCGLPTPTQLLLLLAAADPTGEVALLWRAAAHLGIGPEAAEAAEAAGLLDVGSRVRFRHPLVRSAVYRAAGPAEHRRVHEALATATDPEAAPDRRAWHFAQAVPGVDEGAATELERSAERASARGGSPAAAAFLRRAVELTPDPARRAARALDAAHATHEAGACAEAQELLEVAAAGPLDEWGRARLQLLRAQFAFDATRDGTTPGLLLDAAEALAPLDAALSRETYLNALDAAIIICPTGRRRGVPEVAEAALAAPAAPDPARPVDLLLDGMTAIYTRGYEAGVPVLRRALESLRDEEPSPGRRSDLDHRRVLQMASRAAAGLFDDRFVHELAGRRVRLAREAGALAALPAALLFQAVTAVLTGDLSGAAELVAEQETVARATGTDPLCHGRLVLAAWCGRRAETTELYRTSIDGAAGREKGTEVTLAQYALAVLHNGHGDYEAALDAAVGAAAAYELVHSSITLPELVESAVRTGRTQVAAAALEKLEARAQAAGTEWALGLAARSRALVGAGPAVEKHYREAVERLQKSLMTGHLARTHLLYGGWLRREGRRQDARDQLRTAYHQLTEMGAEAFAAQAGRELRATGERPLRRGVGPTDALTAHELHIARLAAAGATTREIGTQLFLSPRTVETHLRNIFRKLDITSRRQLRGLPLH